MFASKLVHIDLKGGAFKINYWEALVPFLAQIGINGLLIEYEDMFPYRDYLSVINSADVYSDTQIETIIQLANENHLKIIPLVQTFGHLEFVLKHYLFRQLREVDSYPNSICPSNEKSFQLLKDMIKQIVSFHKRFSNVDSIHIGCDEVWHLGCCQRCHQTIEKKHNSNQIWLFLNFVSKIADFIKSNYSMDVIIWDDMIRETDSQHIIDSNLHNLVKPMVWHYLDINSFQLTGEQLWTKYSQLFDRIWIATAFKGASKMNQLIAPTNYHISNHIAWLQVIDKHSISNIEGIAMTGWQRFDHFTTLCELFPNAIISLLMCLFALSEKTFNNQVQEKASNFINSSQILPIDLMDVNTNQIDSIQNDVFPGVQLFKLCFKWMSIVREFKSLETDQSLEGAFTKFQISRNRTNPLHIESFLLRTKILLINANQMKISLESELQEIYYKSTVDEWMDLHVNDIIKKLEKISRNADQQLAVHSNS